jgi:phosphatidate cytidylyltransferase
MILVVLIYFIIGGIATVIINKRKPAEAKSRWIKYVVYFLIVSVMLALIETGLFLVSAAVIIAIGFYEVIRIGQGKTRLIGVLIYTLIATLFVVFARFADQKNQFLLYTTILTFDGFSQISGQLSGKTKLVPSISPGKTIEGLVGGFSIAMLTVIFLSHDPVLKKLVLGLIICAAGLAGDLLASFYKRKSGVKDYSNLIPGHGGVLDRFDSLIFAGAALSIIGLLKL